MKRNIDFERSVGEKVRKLRRNLGLSQQALADFANLEKSQIQRVESAKHSPTLAILIPIAIALGVQPYELLQTDHQLKVNKNVNSPGNRRNVTTMYIRELSSTSYFNRPRSVDEIVKRCEEKYDVVVTSSATSAVLKKLVAEGVLKRAPAKIKTRFLYQKS